MKPKARDIQRPIASRPAAQLLVGCAQAVLLLKVAVALVVFDPRAVDAFVLPKSAIGHVLSVALLGLLGACLWARAVAPGWSWLLLWVSALALSFAIATPLALDTTVALFGADRRFLGLTHMADALVLFLAVALLVRTKRDLALLLGTVLVATIVVSIYGLAQMAGHDLVIYSEATLRPISTVGQPDTLGAYAGLMAITSLVLVGFLWRQFSSIGRIACLVAAASCFVVAYADGARASLLAVAGGAVAALVLFLVAPRRQIGLWHVGLVGLVIIGSALVLASPLASRITPAQLANDPSLASRLQMWQASLRMVGARPLLGVGPDNFAVAYPAMRSDVTVQLDGVDVAQNSTHSWPIYMFTSTGLVGGIAFVGVLVAATFGAVGLRRSGSNAAFAFVPLAAYVGQGLVTVTDPSLDWIAWVSLGVIAAGSTREMRPAWTAGLSRPAIALAFGCAILLIPVALDAQSRIKASEFAGNSEHLLVANRPLDAVTDAGQAVRFDNRRGTYWGRFGSALSAAGSPSAAQSAYADASVREPWQPIWRRDIALQWLQLGNVARAIEALHDAIRIDPHDVISLDLLARLAVNSGNDATAVAYGDRAIELYPARASFYQAPIAAHEGRGEWDVAEREIRVALQYASDPEQPHFHVLLADLLAANGRVAEARAELAWLLANAPNDPEVAALKARLESR